MPKSLQLWCLSLFLVAWAGANGFTQDLPRYYLIGNSLTWDTVPGSLDGDVQWHVDCGKSLPFIHANPEKPCVKTSTLWPSALRGKQYDYVSVQPHYGSTLAEDVETISAWMKLQPKAVFVIHTGWARSASRADEFASHSADEMLHSPVYVRELISALRQLHPGRELRQTLAQNVLAKLAEDIATENAPIDNLESLYRDAIHMTLDHGRYLMHNAMRHALGQPRSHGGFKKLDPVMKKYLDGVLDMLETLPADRELMSRILSPLPATDRPALIAKVTDADLRARLTALLPEIERAAEAYPRTLSLKAEIAAVGGRLICTPTAPQWLYLATGDVGTEIFDVPTAIDLDNGNNPLKGKGGRNEQVSDAWLGRLSGYTTLREVNLSNCAIQGDGLRHIGTLTGLRGLNLTLTPVKDDSLKHLAGLTELRELGLASSQCDGTGLMHLTGLRNLESVNFHFTPLNDAGLRALSRVPVSDRLWIAHTHFTDEGAKALAAQTRLKRCGLGSKNKDSSGEAVAALAKLPLEELALLDNQATPVGIAHASRIATLRKLEVPHAPTVSDESLVEVARMPRLVEANPPHRPDNVHPGKTRGRFEHPVD